MSPGRKDSKAKQQDLRAGTAERLQAIVEAAERAAEGVIDDAEAKARRYLAETRAEADLLAAERASETAALLDSLLGKANALREEAERLQAALEDAQKRIEPEGRRAGGAAEPTDQAEVLTLRVPPSDPEPARGDDRPGAASGARLLATQMAVSGSGREEIAERLRNRFEIEDTSAILDAILGPED